MNDYKEMREGKILLNRFPYNECKDFRRQSQHEKENLYFTTNDDGFFVKMYEAVGNPKADEVEITRYYSESKNKEVRRIVSQKDSDGFEENLPFSTLAECLEHTDAYLTLKNPVDFLVDRDGCLCIQHVSNSGVMEELRVVCRDEKVSDYLCSKARSLRSSLDQEVNNIPERFLLVLADAMYWNSREKIHRFPAENERLEGIYDTYDEAYKVLEEASRSGTPNLTVEIRREIQPDNEDFAPIYGEWLPSFEAHKWQTLGTCADYYGFDWNSMEDYVSGSLRDCYAILHCYRCMKKQMKTMMNMHKWEK